MYKRVLHQSVAALMIAAFSAAPSPAGSLNKCTDTQGKVTYSNLPCANAHESSKIEIDPAPPAPPAPKPAVHAKSDPKKTTRSESEKNGPVKLETYTTAPKKRSTKAHDNDCEKLADKLGKVMDTMDEAQRKGYTQEKMDKWNQEVKALERKKQKADCF
jgi:hypothetical protein